MLVPFVCPVCRGALRASPQALRCSRCGPSPVLAGVPVLVPEPATYCATHRDALLAALAEVDAADSSTRNTLDAFARAVPSSAPALFGDDWTPEEREGAPPPPFVDGPAAALVEQLAALEEESSPRRWLLERVPRSGLVVEVGCGAGLLTAQLCAPERQVVATDLSLRAVLLATRRAKGSVGAVVDAHALPFKQAAAVVCENVVDLLERPAAFFESARRVTKRLLVSTVEPSLGSGAGDVVVALAEAAGFRLVDAADGLPWLRRNSARFVELYGASAYQFE